MKHLIYTNRPLTLGLLLLLFTIVACSHPESTLTTQSGIDINIKTPALDWLIEYGLNYAIGTDDIRKWPISPRRPPSEIRVYGSLLADWLRQVPRPFHACHILLTIWGAHEIDIQQTTLSFLWSKTGDNTVNIGWQTTCHCLRWSLMQVALGTHDLYNWHTCPI